MSNSNVWPHSITVDKLLTLALVIGLMSMHGVKDVHIHEGTVNGDVFEDFVRTTLLPTLQAFSGTNSCSIVVLENASIHYLDRIQKHYTPSRKIKMIVMNE